MLKNLLDLLQRAEKNERIKKQLEEDGQAFVREDGQQIHYVETGGKVIGLAGPDDGQEIWCPHCEELVREMWVAKCNYCGVEGRDAAN